MSSSPYQRRLGVISKQLSAATPAPPAPSPSLDRGQARILEGVVVVELATVVAAPSACALLADFGATVIKVETPEGDMWREEARTIRPAGKGRDDVGGIFFDNTNRGKKSIQLDLKQPAAVEALKRILGTADVFVTNVRQQGLQRLGLDYETLSPDFPALIYAHLTAWGRAGPAENDAGYDAGAFWAASGMADLVRPSEDAGQARYPGGFGDHATSQSLIAGISMALFHKQRTGRGQLVDACLYRTGIWCMGVPILLAQHGYASAPKRSRTETGNPAFNNYMCKDGTAVQLLGLQLPRHMPKTLQVLGLAEICSKDPRFNNPRALMKNRRDLIQMMDEAFATKTFAEWEPLLRAGDVWHTRVKRIEDMTADPQANIIGAFATAPGLEHDFKFLSSPFHLDGSLNHGPAATAPKLGEHNAEVLGTVGLFPTDTLNGKQRGLKPIPQRK